MRTLDWKGLPHKPDPPAEVPVDPDLLTRLERFLREEDADFGCRRDHAGWLVRVVFGREAERHSLNAGGVSFVEALDAALRAAGY